MSQEKAREELRAARERLDNVLGRTKKATTRAELDQCVTAIDEVLRAMTTFPRIRLSKEDMEEATELCRAGLTEVKRRIQNYP